MRRYITCPACGQLKHYYARGLCKPCYDHQYKPTPTPPQPDINLDDYRDYTNQCRAPKPRRKPSK